MPTINDAKCILITGATSGIGRTLALEIAKLPHTPKVIATGRRKERLEELAAAGLHAEYLDLNVDTNALQNSVGSLTTKYPELDTVILNAGIQHQFKVREGIEMYKILEEINVNYLSVIGFISHILPHFLKLSDQGLPSFIITVTSGLGIVPLARVMNYSASKAALSSFTTSLRAQLDETNIKVIEIIPPLVESELHDQYGTTELLSKSWMPLDQFTKFTLEGLLKGDDHIPIGNSKDLFDKHQQGKYDAVLRTRKMTDNW